MAGTKPPDNQFFFDFAEKIMPNEKARLVQEAFNHAFYQPPENREGVLAAILEHMVNNHLKIPVEIWHEGSVEYPRVAFVFPQNVTTRQLQAAARILGVYAANAIGPQTETLFQVDELPYVLRAYVPNPGGWL